MYIYVIFIFLFNYRKVYPWLPRVGDKFYMKGSCYLPCIETNCTGMPDTAFPSFSQSTCCHYLRFCIKQSNSITIMKWFRNRCPIIPLEERVCSKRWLKIHYFASDSFVKGGGKNYSFSFWSPKYYASTFPNNPHSYNFTPKYFNSQYGKIALLNHLMLYKYYYLSNGSEYKVNLTVLFNVGYIV